MALPSVLPLAAVTTKGEAFFHLPGVTENYAVIACAGGKPVYAAVKYRCKRTKTENTAHSLATRGKALDRRS